MWEFHKHFIFLLHVAETLMIDAPFHFPADYHHHHGDMFHYWLIIISAAFFFFRAADFSHFDFQMWGRVIFSLHFIDFTFSFDFSSEVKWGFRCAAFRCFLQVDWFLSVAEMRADEVRWCREASMNISSFLFHYYFFLMADYCRIITAVLISSSDYFRRKHFFLSFADYLMWGAIFSSFLYFRFRLFSLMCAFISMITDYFFAFDAFDWCFIFSSDIFFDYHFRWGVVNM